MKNFKRWLYWGVSISVVALSPPVSASEEEISTNLSIVGTTVWEGTKILNGSQVKVEAGAELIIRPGTTVVGNNGSMIYVLGKLSSVGEKEKKIRFTSDELQKQNFTLAFFIETGTQSEIKMENFILEQGGGNQNFSNLPALTVRGQAELRNGIIRRNRVAAIRNWGKDLEIENCEIYENENFSVENKSTQKVMAKNNWWGSDVGPSFSNDGGNGRLGGIIEFDPWQKKGPRPVILLPGIGGSLSFRLLNDSFHDYWWLNPIGTGAYRSFVKNLLLSGYQYKKNFLWGFYDWRLSNQESASRYLEKLIGEIKQENGHFQVDLVAHSMGGLLARSYLQSDYFKDDVDHLVTLGTPHLGSSDVYSLWENDKPEMGSLPIDIYLWYLEIINAKKNKKFSLREEVSSLGEMLPIYDYLQDKDNGEVIKYSSQRVKNSFLEQLRSGAPVLRRRVKVSVFAGLEEATLEKIKVDQEAKGENFWRDGRPDPFPSPKDTAKGDGRVTELSALADNHLGEPIAFKSDHGDLLLKGTNSVFDQIKVKPKYPMVSESLHYFIFGLEGLVDFLVEDDLGDTISQENKSIPEAQVFSEEAEGLKLVYADFPLAVGGSPRKVKLKLVGGEDSDINFSFWHVNAEGNFEQKKFKKSVGPGVKLEYELSIGKNDNGQPQITVLKERYSNSISLVSPRSQDKILNWKRLKPEVAFWRPSGKVGATQSWLNGKSIDSDLIDLADLELGKQTLKVKNSWDEFEEESAVDFEVDTSMKSLATLVNRAYAEKKINDWDQRSRILSRLSSAYQKFSNGFPEEAREVLSSLRRDLESKDFEIDGKEREKLIKFLSHLESHLA